MVMRQGLFFAYVYANLKLFFNAKKKDMPMERKVAVIAIVVKDPASVERLNELLHDYADDIIGRMGIPYRAKKINIISVVVDAPHDVISALSGKIGNLKGVAARTLYSGVDE